MDDSIPSLSAGAVGSRFVSQEELDTAKAKRDEQWKAAYARSFAELHRILLPQLTNELTFRLGQEPPPQPVEDVFDGRSLAEVCALSFAPL